MKLDTNVTLTQEETAALARAIQVTKKVNEFSGDMPEDLDLPYVYGWEARAINKLSELLFTDQVQGAKIRVVKDNE